MSELRFYEQVLVLHPDSSEAEHKEICQTLEQMIEKSKGGNSRSQRKDIQSPPFLISAVLPANAGISDFLWLDSRF